MTLKSDRVSILRRKMDDARVEYNNYCAQGLMDIIKSEIGKANKLVVYQGGTEFNISGRVLVMDSRDEPMEVIHTSFANAGLNRDTRWNNMKFISDVREASRMLALSSGRCTIVDGEGIKEY